MCCQTRKSHDYCNRAGRVMSNCRGCAKPHPDLERWSALTIAEAIRNHEDFLLGLDEPIEYLAPSGDTPVSPRD